MKKNILTLFLLIASLFFIVSCDRGEKPEPPLKPSITLNKSEIELKVSETFQMVAEVLNSEEEVVWEIDDPLIATISESGLITGIAIGTTNARAVLGDISKSVKVTVKDEDISEEFPVLDLSHTKVEILEGSEGLKVTAKVFYQEVEQEGVVIEWVVEDETVATVLDGVITGLKVGTTTITVKTEFDGTLLEETIEVIVKTDASIDVSLKTTILNAVTFNGQGKTSEIITATAKVSGEVVTDVEITFTTENDDIVDLVVTDSQVEIIGKEIGVAFVTASFLRNDLLVSTVIEVTVEKLMVSLENIFTVDVSDEESLHLNLEDHTWKDDLLEIKVKDEVISEGNSASIKKEWVDLQNLGDVFEISFVTKYVDYKASLKISKSYQELGFKSANAETGDNYTKLFEGDKSTHGFDADDIVYEYFSGVSGWGTRMTTDVKIPSYDWFIFDVVFLEEPVVNNVFNFWLGTSHVTLLNVNGAVTVLQAGPNYTPGVDKVDHVKVYVDGKQHQGGFTTGVKYTIEINMKYRGESNDDFIGFKDPTKILIGNAFAASQDYYDKHLVKEEEETEILYVEMALAGSTGEFSKLGPDMGFDNVWKWMPTSLWGDRLQVTNSELANYDYFVVNMLFMQPLEDIVFYMDVVNNVITLRKDGTVSKQDMVKVYNSAGELHTGALSPGEVYQFVVKLIHGDPRYGVAYNVPAGTTPTIFVADTHFITSTVHDQRYLAT